MTNDLYTEFRKLSPKVTGGLARMRQEKLFEFLNVAMTVSGCLGEQWALKAYEDHIVAKKPSLTCKCHSSC